MPALQQLALCLATHSCDFIIDSHDPVHGPVRAGDDLSCTPLGNSTLVGCATACCETDGCLSFSFNEPWSASTGPYMGCVAGQNCCCLKGAVPALEPNKWAMNITSGVISAPPFRCSKDLDCNLNGECDAATGACACDAAWRAADCGELNLLPVADIKGAYETAGVDLADCATSCGPSSWGGLPFRGEDGQYHLFVSQFVNNCTLKGFNPGSSVVRAVASHPAGPFTYAETVMGTFHHNPAVVRVPAAHSGTGAELYVMFMIGDDVAPPVGHGAACAWDAAADPHHLEGFLSMASAPSVLGPWTKVRHAILPSGGVDEWDAMVTNPGPLLLSNGTALLFYRGTRWPQDGLERIGLAKSEGGWAGPYGRLQDAPLWGPMDDAAKYVEDPSVWQDERGFHMLAHGHWDERGYYACAEKAEGPWQFRLAPAYTNTLEMVGDMPNITLVQRERPQIFFNESTGEPALLFTGVTPPGAAFYGFTYTHAQPIKQSHHE